jgi:hypothetical protein
MSKIEQLFPFMEEEDLKNLAMKIIHQEVDGIQLTALFPFLSKKDLDEVIQILIDQKDGFHLKRSLPFMSEETMNHVLEAVRNGDIEGLTETHFYPFLSKDTLKNLFDAYVQEASVKEKKDA